MAKIDKFLGKWKLIPERATYDLGSPPTAGTYEIIADGQELTFKMAWTDVEGVDHQMSYSEICDGRFHPYLNADFADEICLTLNSETLLNSVARKSGAVMMTAQRVLLSDSEMQVTMSGPMPDGTSYHNIAIYRKINHPENAPQEV